MYYVVCYSLVDVLLVGHGDRGMVTVQRTSQRRGPDDVDQGTRVVGRVDIRAGRAGRCAAVRQVVSEVRSQELSDVAGFANDLGVVNQHAAFEQREYNIKYYKNMYGLTGGVCRHFKVFLRSIEYHNGIEAAVNHSL